MKKITITLDEAVYEGLKNVVGKGSISKFLCDLARPYVVKKELANAYKQMSKNKEREAEADEWVENLTTNF
ncbi:MAG TPA: addiction module antitoxin [Alphaproteobacteria bacterium]|nr:addiction module antitoxin [Alphaproteobacteria bacterium]